MSPKSVRGWVLWRDHPDLDPLFQLGTLVFDDLGSKFVAERPNEGAEYYVVPGFVDLHSHLAVGPGGPLDDAAITENAWKEIRAGILAIREPGSPKKVPNRLLPFDRPIVVRAGRHIALEKRYIRGMAVELAPGEEEDVADALAEQVAIQAAAGDGWVKLVGDWIDRSKGEQSDLDPLWTEGQLRRAVEVAHDHGAKVAVHTFSSPAIPGVLAAKVDSIEHGSGMSAEQMAKAAEDGIPVIPTLLQVCKFREFSAAAHRYPVYAKTMADMFERRRDWFQELMDSGVEILPGSDAGGYQEHGALISELQRWVEWGMSPSRALAIGTWRARDFLGLPSLSEGAPADAVVFDRDPRVDAGVWSNPVAVIANGHLIDLAGDARV